MLPGLRAAGLEILVFRRELRTFALQRRRLRRLHRKTAVIDGKLGFVGGINIIDDQNTPRHDPPRFDYAVSLRGPIVGDLASAQNSLWRILSWARIRRRPAPVPSAPRPPAAGHMAASLVLRDNLRRRRDIENAYLEAIEHAQREVLIASAYFLPGRRFRNALIDASRRGVTVTLLLQGRTEYWLMRQAEQALYPHLLGAGVRIVEYRKSFLHAKVAVIDDDWATVGSSNIDPFSLLLAREANVIVRDAGFCRTLRADIENAMRDGGVALREDHWQHLSWPRRVLSWCAFGVVRWLAGRLATPQL
ncbi:MAG: phospholipase D-like domain-containing protein [Rhodocyclaceae bacterium]